MEEVWEPISRAFPIQGVLLSFPWYGKTMRKHMTFPYDEVYHMMEIYLFIYFQFIYRWQILFHRTIRLAFTNSKAFLNYPVRSIKLLSMRQLGTYDNTSSNTTKETKTGK